MNKNCVARYTIFANAKMNEAGDTPAPRSSGWHTPAETTSWPLRLRGAIGEGQAIGYANNVQPSFMRDGCLAASIFVKTPAVATYSIQNRHSLRTRPGDYFAQVLFRVSCRSWSWHENGSLLPSLVKAAALSFRPNLNCLLIRPPREGVA